MKQALFIIFVLCAAVSAQAQYAPQAGLPGSAAIFDTSDLFEGWATSCIVQRGYQNIADTSLGLATAGIESDALGIADDNTVSLGDSGVAVVSFASPIYDGPGPDFAVFENGFLNQVNDSQAFLELGFVEVSSDSVHFVRFPSSSLTQTQTQTGPFGYTYANALNNLAGIYIAYYGTPFDLAELADSPNLDISNIKYVRLIDVVGSISGHSTYDAAGRIINDPFPTPYPTCGFDLDAVGVIHQKSKEAVMTLTNDRSISTYPNPVTDRLTVEAKGIMTGNIQIAIMTATGNPLQQQMLSQQSTDIDMRQYPAGLYYLVVKTSEGNKWVEKIIKD